jgi:hypothetical protein
LGALNDSTIEDDRTGTFAYGICVWSEVAGFLEGGGGVTEGGFRLNGFEDGKSADIIVTRATRSLSQPPNVHYKGNMFLVLIM